MSITELARRTHAIIDGGLWKLGVAEWTACDELDCGICAALELVLVNVVEMERVRIRKIVVSEMYESNDPGIEAAVNGACGRIVMQIGARR